MIIIINKQIPVFHFKDIKYNTDFSVENHVNSDEFYIAPKGSLL